MLHPFNIPQLLTISQTLVSHTAVLNQNPRLQRTLLRVCPFFFLQKRTALRCIAWEHGLVSYLQGSLIFHRRHHRHYDTTGHTKLEFFRLLRPSCRDALPPISFLTCLLVIIVCSSCQKAGSLRPLPNENLCRSCLLQGTKDLRTYLFLTFCVAAFHKESCIFRSEGCV